MKLQKSLISFATGISIGLNSLLIISSPTNVFTFGKYYQLGNRIDGTVFGSQRQPVSDVNVELLDEFSRYVGRSQTTAAGRYSFSGIPAGRFRVRILPFNSNYEEQVQEVEIVNFTLSTPTGVRTSGYENVHLDIYLRQRKQNQALGGNGVIFVQDVPESARKIYENSVSALEAKKKEEGLNGLKSALDIFPNYYLALERLGREYIQLQKYENARLVLNKAVEVNPQGFTALYELGYTLFLLKKSEEAVTIAQKALNLNQTSIDALVLLGTILRQAKQYEAAEVELKKANKIAKGKISEIHWQLALLYAYNLKRYDAAAAELETFLKLQPESKDSEQIKILIKDFRSKSKK